MCSKKQLIKNMNDENFWLHAGIHKYNSELLSLSKKIISLLSDKRISWNSKEIEPSFFIDNDANSIGLICECNGIQCAKVVFNSKRDNEVLISAYTVDNRKKKCYINISWDECIKVISDIIS